MAQLRAIWQSYLDKLEYAATQLPETKKYPPDPKLMKAGFGWTASDSDAVRKLYLSNKAFAGKAWKNLRKALSTPALAPGDWGGSWFTLTNGGGLTLTVRALPRRSAPPGHEVRRTISADAKTLKARGWSTPTRERSGARVYEFMFTQPRVRLATSFTGQYWRQDGTGRASTGGLARVGSAPIVLNQRAGPRLVHVGCTPMGRAPVGHLFHLASPRSARHLQRLTSRVVLC